MNAEKVRVEESSGPKAGARERRANPSELSAINIPFAESGERHLRIIAGACRLNVRPGDGEAWVSGTYYDALGSVPCRLTQDGGTVTLSQEFNPSEMFGLFAGAPRFDLVLGKAKPYALTIEIGASDSYFDLGGLPLTRLTISQGASHYAVNFSAPNPQSLALLKFGAGAGGMEIKNLANANFVELRVEGGAAAYQLDFGGSLRQDGRVRIATGMSAVEIAVPASTAAKISHETLMGGLEVGDGFMKKEGAFWTEAALAGKTPLLTIQSNVALGSLRLRVT